MTNLARYDSNSALSPVTNYQMVTVQNEDYALVPPGDIIHLKAELVRVTDAYHLMARDAQRYTIALQERDQELSRLSALASSLQRQIDLLETSSSRNEVETRYEDNSIPKSMGNLLWGFVAIGAVFLAFGALNKPAAPPAASNGPVIIQPPREPRRVCNTETRGFLGFSRETEKCHLE